jgi:hypothetical protein
MAQGCFLTLQALAWSVTQSCNRDVQETCIRIKEIEQAQEQAEDASRSDGTLHVQSCNRDVPETCMRIEEIEQA